MAYERRKLELEEDSSASYDILPPCSSVRGVFQRLQSITGPPASAHRLRIQQSELNATNKLKARPYGKLTDIPAWKCSKTKKKKPKKGFHNQYSDQVSPGPQPSPKLLSPTYTLTSLSTPEPVQESIELPTPSLTMSPIPSSISSSPPTTRKRPRSPDHLSDIEDDSDFAPLIQKARRQKDKREGKRKPYVRKYQGAVPISSSQRRRERTG